MPYRRYVGYRYDGTFAGFLCCVYHSVYQKEWPLFIESGEGQMTLDPVRDIVTDEAQAARVFDSVAERISPRVQRFIQVAFLSCAPQKEVHMLRLLHLGYRVGAKVLGLRGDEAVHAVLRAVQQVYNERHQFYGFARFSDYSGVLVAKIAPKNDVLPLLAHHFCARYRSERFLIYDEVRHQGLFYQNGECRLLPLTWQGPPQPDAQEGLYRALWQRFYDTIAVEGRENERCRMGHMPKRFWHNMTEFWDEEGRDIGVAFEQESGPAQLQA